MLLLLLDVAMPFSYNGTASGKLRKQMDPGYFHGIAIKQTKNHTTATGESTRRGDHSMIAESLCFLESGSTMPTRGAKYCHH